MAPDLSAHHVIGSDCISVYRARTESWDERVSAAEAAYRASAWACDTSDGRDKLEAPTYRSSQDGLTLALAGFASALPALSFEFATEDDILLLTVAWATLRSEIDLVRFSISTLPHYRHRAPGNLLAGIHRGSMDFRIGLADPDGFHAPACTSDSVDPPDDHLHIDVGWEFWVCRYAIPFARAKAGGDIDAMWLVVLDLAGSVLHELSHVYCVAGPDPVRQDIPAVLSGALLTLGIDPNRQVTGCENSYLLENMFRWAALKRYAGASCSDCAKLWLNPGRSHADGDGVDRHTQGTWDVDFLYGWDGIVYLTCYGC